MTIKKHQLNLLANFLGGCKKGVKFTDLRIRDSIIKQIITHAETFDKQRIQILEELADKDEEGKSIKTDNAFQLTENKTKFEEEYKILAEETVEIEMDKEKVKKMIEDHSEYPAEFGEVELLDKMFE